MPVLITNLTELVANCPHNKCNNVWQFQCLRAVRLQASPPLSLAPSAPHLSSLVQVQVQQHNKTKIQASVLSLFFQTISEQLGRPTLLSPEMHILQVINFFILYWCVSGTIIFETQNKFWIGSILNLQNVAKSKKLGDCSSWETSPIL